MAKIKINEFNEFDPENFPKSNPLVEEILEAFFSKKIEEKNKKDPENFPKSNPLENILEKKILEAFFSNFLEKKYKVDPKNFDIEKYKNAVKSILTD